MWWYLRIRFTLWGLRVAWRVIRWLALVAVLAAAAPVTLVAAVGFAGAWLRGWPPGRLRRAAWWSLPMTGAYLAGRGLHAATWQAFLLAPVHDWQHAWDQASAGHLLTAFALTAPVAVPAGLLAAAGLWAWRTYTIETGLSGQAATAPVVFDARQWRRAARAARGRVTAPGAFPLTSRDRRIVMGATIRAARWPSATLDCHGSSQDPAPITEKGRSARGRTAPRNTRLTVCQQTRPCIPLPLIARITAGHSTRNQEGMS